MNDHNILAQAGSIFDSPEKWNAFFEIQTQIPAIIDHWLRIGSNALREHFKLLPSPLWECSEWGGARDSRWYLSEFGPRSIGIGFGWSEWELHLHFNYSDLDRYDQEKAIQHLGSSEYYEVQSLFGSHSVMPWRKGDGCIASDRSFNPYGDTSDSNMRNRIIAWHAGNKTDDFVEKMAKKVREITENTKITALIRDLNNRSLRASNIL